MTTTVQIIITGILAYSFNTLNLNFILSNIILIPIFEVITIIGIVHVLLIGLFMCFSQNVEIIFSYVIIEQILRCMYMIIDLMLELIIITTKILSDFKFNIYINNYNIFIYIIYYLDIIGICIYIFLKEQKKSNEIIRDIRKMIIILSMTMIICMVVDNIYNVIKRENMAYFVDIGQGDASVIQTKDGKNILVDTGEGESSRYPAGKKILFPYILKRNIHKIDMLVISHFDSDHSGGAKYILENMQVDKIIISPQYRYSKQYIDVITTILKNSKKGKKTKVIYGINGQTITCGKYFNMRIYGPTNRYITKNILNNNSLVFLANVGSKKILYTGDIEKPAEEELVKRIKGIEVDYLKVAHHGSKSSTTDIFLNSITCKHFVISCRSK